MTRSGTTRLHRRAQAQREAGRRGSTHPGAQPSAIRSSSRTRVGQASAPPTYRHETLSSRARQRVGRSHPNATKPCRAGRGSESGAQRRKMHASHKRRGPGGTHFNQDQRASGTGLPIAQNPTSNFCGITKLSQSESRPPGRPPPPLTFKRSHQYWGKNTLKANPSAPVGAEQVAPPPLS